MSSPLLQEDRLCVPFLDLQAVNAASVEALRAAASQVIQSGWYVRGKVCREFESEFADYCGVAHCVGVGNGLDALKLTLKAWRILGEINPGAEVIMPAQTFVATALAVVESGLTPVFVEANPETYLVDVDSVRSAVTERTQCVIAVHLYGQPADMAELRQLCQSQRIKLLEDAAQAHGARYQGRRCGGLADAAAFSFYPTKNLGALGDGGAVTTNDLALADCIRSLGNYGSSQKYVHEHQGCNSRLDELQAALLRVKLPNLDSENERRRAVASRYLSEIVNPHIGLPKLAVGRDPVWHLFVVRTDNRDAFQAHMQECGVQTAVHYPVPPHQQAALSGAYQVSLPTTERLHRQVVSLPISPVHRDAAITAVIKAVNDFRSA